MAQKGFLRFVLLNRTTATIYVGVINGTLLDDGQTTFCVHIFFERPEGCNFDITVLEPQTALDVSFPEREHIFFSVNAPVSCGVNKTDDRLTLALWNVQQAEVQQGTN